MIRNLWFGLWFKNYADFLRSARNFPTQKISSLFPFFSSHSGRVIPAFEDSHSLEGSLLCSRKQFLSFWERLLTLLTDWLNLNLNTPSRMMETNSNALCLMQHLPYPAQELEMTSNPQRLFLFHF